MAWCGDACRSPALRCVSAAVNQEHCVSLEGGTDLEVCVKEWCLPPPASTLGCVMGKGLLKAGHASLLSLAGLLAACLGSLAGTWGCSNVAGWG